MKQKTFYMLVVSCSLVFFMAFKKNKPVNRMEQCQFIPSCCKQVIPACCKKKAEPARPEPGIALFNPFITSI